MKAKFIVPNPKTRSMALGSLDKLTKAQKKAYLEPEKFFRPIEDPSKYGGWLASQPEKGQTFQVIPQI